MSEEEVIKQIKDMIIAFDVQGYIREKGFIKEELKASNVLQEMLDLYNKQQKEIEQLANGIRVLGTNLDITTEEIIKEFTEKPITEEYIKKFKSGYISKDEVLKAIGYEENDEEYERLKQDNEKLLAILDTLYSEVCRLEDIEDKKVEVAVNFIEERRDKYWQKKINNKIKELEKEKEKYKGDKGLRYSQVGFIQSGINVLNKLLEEE